jgi:hypothetical protein
MFPSILSYMSAQHITTVLSDVALPIALLPDWVCCAASVLLCTGLLLGYLWAPSVISVMSTTCDVCFVLLLTAFDSF